MTATDTGNTANKSVKRKRLILSDKIEVIADFEKGKPASLIAFERKISEQSVRDIYKRKHEIKAFAKKMDCDPSQSKRKNLKKCKYELLDELMIKWFQQQREAANHLTGPICLEVAKEFAEELGIPEDFLCSRGWFDKFKDRYGIRDLPVHGEKLSSNSESADSFVEFFRRLIVENDFSLTQIYNCDETRLYWKGLPKRTLALRNESNLPGRKASKEAVTLMLCANASGDHKLPLTVVGKSTKPRCFRNKMAHELNFRYYGQKGGWMTQQIFLDWFNKEFIPKVTEFLRAKNLPLKAILILDNCRAHPPSNVLKSEDGGIFALFLPPNVTPLIQPLDQGTIYALKCRYKSKFVRRHIRGGSNFKEFLSNFELFDALVDCFSAWNEISNEAIRNSWNKILPRNLNAIWDFDNEVNKTFNDLLTLFQQQEGGREVTIEDIKEWLDSDKNSFEIRSSSELIEEMRETAFEKEKSGTESEHEDIQENRNDLGPKVQVANLIHNIDCIINDLNFLNADEYEFEVQILSKLVKKLETEVLLCKKQSSLLNYFGKS